MQSALYLWQSKSSTRVPVGVSFRRAWRWYWTTGTRWRLSGCATSSTSGVTARSPCSSSARSGTASIPDTISRFSPEPSSYMLPGWQVITSWCAHTQKHTHLRGFALRCFDTVGWTTGRASGRKNSALSNPQSSSVGDKPGIIT